MIEQKNMIMAVVISIVILLGWQYLYEAPRMAEQRALQEQRQKEEAAQNAQLGGSIPGSPVGAGAPQQQGAQSGTTGSGATGGPRLGVNMSSANKALIGGSATPTQSESREAALKASPRVPLHSDRLDGSISLVGGRIDDLILRDYRESLDKNSSEIVLLWPTDTQQPYYAEFGWLGKDVKLPKADTLWKTRGSRLSPKTPLLLTWDNGEGLTFERHYSLDENYMITLTQRVKNNTRKDVSLAPYGLISRTGTPDILGFYILHEGLIGVFDEVLKEVDYSDLVDDGAQRQKIGRAHV